MIKFKKLIAGLTLGVLSVGMGVGVIHTENTDIERADAEGTPLLKADLTLHEGNPGSSIYSQTTIVSTNNNGYLFSTSIVGAANFNNQWQHYRFGRNKDGGEASITTDSPIGDAINKIDLNVTSFKNGTPIGFDVYASQDKSKLNDLASKVGRFDFETENPTTGLKTINLQNTLVNSYYKVSLDYTSNSTKNGVVEIDSFTFYKDNTVRTLDSITAKLKNSTKVFYPGDILTKSDISVYANLSNGALYDVTDLITITNPTLEAGTNNVEIKFTSGAVTKTIILPIACAEQRVAQELVITGDYTNKELVDGQLLNTKDLKVAVKYNNGTTEDITSKINGTTLKFVFYKKGTNEVITKLDKTLTSYDVGATLTGDADFAGLTLVSKTRLTLTGYTIIDRTMNLSWYGGTFVYKPGELFVITGTIKAYYNDKTSETLDLATAKVKVLLNGKEIDIATRKLTSNDDASKVKISYTKDGVTGYSKENTLTVTSLSVYESTIKDLRDLPENDWANAANVPTIKLGEVTITAVHDKDANPAKYYNSGTNWRVYKNTTITISVPETLSLREIKVAYSGKITGLKNNVYVDGLDVNKLSFRVTDNAKITYLSIKVGEALTLEGRVQNWIDKYMHMDDTKYQGDGTGLCNTDKTYVNAKAALVNRNTELSGIIDEFTTNSKFTAAHARYLKWAKACKDTTPFVGTEITPVNPLVGHMGETNIVAIILVISILSVTAISLLAIAKRKKATR